jgi:hypothetical protein
MSKNDTTVTFRQRFERAAALFLGIATTATVGGGTIVMMMQ